MVLMHTNYAHVIKHVHSWCAPPNPCAQVLNRDIPAEHLCTPGIQYIPCYMGLPSGYSGVPCIVVHGWIRLCTIWPAGHTSNPGYAIFGGMTTNPCQHAPRGMLTRISGHMASWAAEHLCTRPVQRCCVHRCSCGVSSVHRA